MAPEARGLLRLLVLSFFAFTSVTSGSPPTVSSSPNVATLHQYETSSVTLSTLTCNDPDGGQCSISLSRVYPSSPCGNCFSIFPCAGKTYCVKYSPGLGYFNPSVESQYLLTVTATDDQSESDPVKSTTIVDVRIKPNSLPVFDTYPVMAVTAPWPPANAKATGSGVTLYTVIANDTEGDVRTYTMTTVPYTDSLRIDPLSGAIRTTKLLRYECRSNIAAMVYVQDSVNTGTQVGPFVVNIELNNANSAPIITNLNSEIRVRENENLNTPVMTLAMFDDDTAVTYTMSTSPASAANLFQIDPSSNELRVKSAIDFETQPQTITMTIKASDGFCTSETYTLTVKLVDINEPPTLGPRDQTIESCEGYVDIVPDWNATDVDAHDKGLLRYISLAPNTEGRFAIDEQTGVVSTLVDYDVDQNSMPHTVTLTTIISDVQGLSATATLTVRFIDCNDNAPIFIDNSYAFEAKDCDPPGSILGIVKAKDLDSEYEQNNVFTFSGSAPGIMVQPGGTVVTTSTMAAGTVVTMEVYATDKGKTPGPLRSKSPAYVSVNVIECTTPPPPPARVTVTTAVAVTTLANVADILDVNLGWIVAAALIGALLTGFTIYMLYRYCWPGLLKLIKAGCCKSRPPPRTVTPVRRPTPPAQKQKPTPGFIFGWWKEQYPDEDYKHEPDRLALPEPSKSIDTPIDTNTRDIDPVVPPTPPPPAQNSCTIL